MIAFTRVFPPAAAFQTQLWLNGGEHGRCVGEDVTGCFSRFIRGGFCRRLAGKQNAKKVLGLAEKAVAGQTRRNTEEARPVMTDTNYHATDLVRHAPFIILE